MTTRGSLDRSAAATSGVQHQSSRPATEGSSFAEGVPAATTSVALRAIGRFGWGVADQLLSSATNFLLGVLVARSVGAADLGAFSVAYTMFTFSLGAVRATAGELLVIRHSALSAGEWRRGVERSAGTALMTGTVVGAGCLVGSAVVGGSFGSVLGILGASLPFLLVQDVWRFALLARGRGSAALLNDAAWAVVMFAALAVSTYSGASSVVLFTLSWTAGGCFAAAVGLLQLKVVPSGPIAAVRWLRSHSDIAPRFFAEFGVSTGVWNLTFFAIGGIAGLGELGRLRAGEIVLGPLTILFAGVGIVATAEGVRLLQSSRGRLLRGCQWLSVVLAAGVLAWGAMLLLVPRSIGESVLGANWAIGRSLLPPLLIAFTAYASSFGASIGLHCLGAAKRSLRAKCIDGVLTLFFGLAGAYLAGAKGVAWGFSAAWSLRSVNTWWQFSRALREHERRSEVEALPETPVAAGG